jgi:tRNA(Arg) A34 adenosine deaminase TadA
MNRSQQSRRYFIRVFVRVAAMLPLIGLARANEAKHPDVKWYREAERMRTLAESWGDRSYGAVVVRDGAAIGLGPSRVVKDRDANAHADRVAIREAIKAHGAAAVAGAILYSTSRPCALCERAAASAGIARMYFGANTEDAGKPRAIN